MRYDIVAEDARGNPVILVEVKATVLDDDAAASLLGFMREAHAPARYAMVADFERIRIKDYHESEPLGGFTCFLDSPPILRHYDPEFGQKRIRWYYLTSLVEAWLRDVIHHWKTEIPPGSEQLATLGISQLLEGGTTNREVVIEADSVR